MSKPARAALGVLVLGAGVALVVRFAGGGGSAPAAAPPPAPPRPPAAVEAAIPPSTSAGSIALRWIEFLGGQLAKPPAGPQEEELARSRQRQFADEVKRRLAEDPARWGDVLEVVSEEDPRIGRKVVESLHDAVGDRAEGELLRLLQSGRHRETRMASATLVASRSTTESFWGLVAAAQQDADPGVRYQALSELAKRQARAVSPAETTTIDQTLRLRAQVDPDPEVRRFALRATGQVRDTPPAGPPPAPPKGEARRK